MKRWVEFTTLVLKIVLPITTLSICAVVAWLLILTRPATPQREIIHQPPAVQVVEVDDSPVAFAIRSQGQVLPRTATTLVAQVSGRVVAVADAVKNNGFFQAGDVLVRIDPRDYEVQIRRLEALLAAARAKLDEATREYERNQSLSLRNAISQSALDQATAARDVAQAEIARLEAELQAAKHSLSYTTIFAPFDGCVEKQHVDAGQYVTVGTPLALCFAIDAAEVRLPVTDQQFGYLNLPLGKSLDVGTGPAVRLETSFAGSQRAWQGRIVRSEAIVDSKSRMVYLVARVEQPYAQNAHNEGQPMAIGMFVDAAIEVPATSGTFALPESCVTTDGSLLVVDDQNRLEPKAVRVLHRDSERVIVAGDLAPGQRVCATRLDQPVPGMPVQVVADIPNQPQSRPHAGTAPSTALQPRTGGAGP